jgi:hypothetical protein
MWHCCCQPAATQYMSKGARADLERLLAIIMLNNFNGITFYITKLF